jgi:D-3-phosphoglycerate dehydrogenase
MKILIVSPVFRDALESLSRTHDVTCAYDASEKDLTTLIADRDVLIFRSGVNITADVMAAAPGLKLLIRAGSGLDNVDLDYVGSHRIALERIEQPGAKAVAELAFGLMLGVARGILKADALLRQGHWAKHQITGHLLSGKVLGVYGAGNIGARVGAMGAAWGMEVIGCVENPTSARVLELEKRNIKLVDSEDVLARSDYLSLHVPLHSSTRKLFNADVISRMKKGSFLVNLTRGGVVDEAALLDALESGHLAGAGTDVHEREGEGFISPLAELENVILTPHMGAGTVDSQREIGERILEIVDSFDGNRKAS